MKDAVCDALDGFCRQDSEFAQAVVQERSSSMSEMEVTEGQLLSQDFGVGGPPAAVEIPAPIRTAGTVALEIRTLQSQARGIILSYAIEIGRRLEDKAQRLQDALSEANTAAQAAEEEHTRLTQELEKLRNRPAEADTEAVEAARRAAIAEMTEKVNTAKAAKKEADEKHKTVQEALAAAKRELSELKSKEPEVRELTQEEKDALTAEAVEKARAEGAEQIRGLEKKLALADPNVAEFKIRFNSWREEHQKMMEVLGRIAQVNEEQAAKFMEAVKATLEQMASS